jgi:HEPN domain-containing protein
MRHDPHDPEAWFDYAEEDLVRAEKRLAEPDVVDALNHMQQSAEKALKGKLIGLGWDLIKTHNLTFLSKELAKKGFNLSWFEATGDLLTAQYIIDRYPHTIEPLPDSVALQSALDETRRLFEELSGRKRPA